MLVKVVVSAAVVTAIAAAARRVLQRPQPIGPAELVEADEAIRGRSLCVLTGSTIAIAGYLAAWLAAGLQSADVVVSLTDSARPMIAIGTMLLPMLGAITAFAVAHHAEGTESTSVAAAPGTVTRAYHELELADIVTSRVRHGTTIAARPKPSRRETKTRLAAAAHAYAQTVAALQLTRDQAIAELDRHLIKPG